MKRFFTILILASMPLILASCECNDKSGGGDKPGDGVPLTVSDIKDLPANAAQVKVLVYDDELGDGVALVTADIEDRGFELDLPATIDGKYLELLKDEQPEEISFSDENVKVCYIAFKIYGADDSYLGDIYLQKTTTSYVGVDYIYADRACKISGSFAVDDNGDRYSVNADMDLVKGWNKVANIEMDTSMDFTTDIPAGVAWVFHAW